MSEHERQTTKSQATNNDQAIHEKSADLRTYANSLLEEARDLCRYSRQLRAMNGLIAATNSNGNASRKRAEICATAARVATDKRKRFSVNVPLRVFESNSSGSVKFFDESKVLYQDQRKSDRISHD